MMVGQLREGVHRRIIDRYDPFIRVAGSMELRGESRQRVTEINCCFRYSLANLPVQAALAKARCEFGGASSARAWKKSEKPSV
jgi:hypothetical protein